AKQPTGLGTFGEEKIRYVQPAAEWSPENTGSESSRALELADPRHTVHCFSNLSTHFRGFSRNISVPRAAVWPLSFSLCRTRQATTHFTALLPLYCSRPSHKSRSSTARSWSSPSQSSNLRSRLTIASSRFGEIDLSICI